MSGLFDDGSPEPVRRTPPPGSPQRSRALIGTIIVLVIVFFVVSVFTGVWTDRLWFKSVGYSGVFTKVLGTKILLFLVFGLLMGAVVAANVVLAYRFRPLFRPPSQEQANLDRYREVVDPLRKIRIPWNCQPPSSAFVTPPALASSALPLPKGSS